jgi:hypothetical protein
MTGKERRGRANSAIFIDCGRLLKPDPNYGLPVICYVCDAPHSAFGLAQISNGSEVLAHVPLCEACLEGRDTHPIIRKFWNTPDLEISEGSEATTEQLLALAEKQDEVEH